MSEPVAPRRARYFAILVGVVVGYFAGRMCEDRMGWENARMVAMPIGGLLAGVLARFTFFRDPSDSTPTRRSRS